MTLTKQDLRAVIRALDFYGGRRGTFLHRHGEDYGIVRELRKALAAQLVEELDDPDSAEAAELKSNGFAGAFRE